MKGRRRIGAVVLAAGLGTRMRTERAKVLHELGGRPLISYPLAALRQIGADPIVVVVGHQAEAVRAVCAPFGAQFALQREQRGTGHAVRTAAPALRGFDGDLFLVNGDLPFVSAASFRALAQAHRRRRAAVSLLTAEISDPAGFGRIVRESGRVVAIVEDKDTNAEQYAIREINVGLYCARQDFLFAALRRLRPTNVQGELYLTDIVAQARSAGLPIGDAAAAVEEATQVSTLVDLASCERTLRAGINRSWMERGVTLVDPDTTYISPDVTIAPDTVIGPNTRLAGATRIGRGCRIDGTAFLTDANLGDGVHLKPGVVITAARVGAGAVVGPFAQLRPGTDLGPGVHIGNFVETKMATLGAGTKANHLAYLGDAEIGADTNIGAGTITCNYDGFRKHRTRIGDRVQVGSDTTLVAPVAIGDDAYIATASTVRKDVAPGTLFFNVRRDMERPGWVEARRRQEESRSAVPKPARKQRGTRKKR